MSRRWMHGILAALALARAVAAGPLDSHPTGGPWSQTADSARHEVALAVLVRDLALTPEQAGKLLGLLKRVDRTIRGLASGSDGPASSYKAAMARLRDRVLATPAGLPALTREDVQARRTWDENVGQLEREVGPLREEVAGLLDAAQKKTLRSFSVERTLHALGFDDEELDDWTQRLAALRAVPEAELEDRVREEYQELLHEAGHPERLPEMLAALKAVRALPADRFDQQLVANARKIRALLAVGPPATPAPSELTELHEAIDTHLLDMRMIPVLTSWLAARKKDPATR